ncbi:NnrS family protein [Wenzhouxiangella sp. AB-CW3]|uniref:NnrS family protein n=1 Tax=Wenzhouxiangella sp. AB-CW3 TaxID=2771012 RepID=UPI00168A716A|nr:NnrS family protein [Wenzhouxiangella sp. AB-CW3]QOC22944.1 NnrS family protein [Wenzhouxiangella sp. AB-CW3]
MSTQSLASDSTTTFSLWASPFRPFFLATGLYAIAVIAYWLGAWFDGWPLPESMSPVQWHSHEMLFGMVAAAIAGFLLTAMCNWTGAAPLSGRGLMALFGLWLAGRMAMWTAAWLPGWLVAAIDLSFLLAVAVYAGRVIHAAGNRRNYALVGLIGLLWLANLLFHIGVLDGRPGLIQRAEWGTIMLVVVLMVVIGGRITPAFTRNWLLRTGRQPTAVKSFGVVDSASMISVLVLLAMILAGAPWAWTGAIALLAGAANALRLAGWAGWQVRSDPLMWMLHLGYAWIPLGLLLMGFSPWIDAIGPSAWLHALGTGAMGILILGVMTRVCLGHTGRPLELPAVMVPGYWLVIAAAILRLAGALEWLPYRPTVIAAGLAWIVAFLIFVIAYWPILSQPRADGKPG